MDIEYARVGFTKISQEAVKKHRRFFEQRVRRPFIKYLAYTNQFEGILKADEIETAKTGYLPEDLDVHHIFPLSGSYSEQVNYFPNLSVLHKRFHCYINKNVFKPQLMKLNEMPEDSTIEILLPQFKPVDGDRILAVRENRIWTPSKQRLVLPRLESYR